MFLPNQPHLRQISALTVAATTLLLSAAHAQDAPASDAAIKAPAPIATASSSTVIYDSDYFKPFAPITLEDMIRNIPGGSTLLNSLRRGGGDRGFGSDGPPLLINGRRMSGKSNDISTRLTRIQASQVERIELIRGNAEGLDIRSDGIIYNVILRESSDNSSTNFIEAQLNYSRGAALGPQILLSHSGQKGELEYGISYQFKNNPRVRRVGEDVLSPSRIPLQFRDLTRINIAKSHVFTGNIGYEFLNGTTARLNGLYTDSEQVDTRNEDQFLVSTNGSLNFAAEEQARFRFAHQEWEIGGDVATRLGFLGQLNTLFVITQRKNDNDLIQELITNDVRNQLFSQVADFDENEVILRASITTQLSDKHSLEYGGEGAFNTLDTNFSFNDAPFEQAIVKEDRYEVFATHNFKISSKLNLQSGITGEFSTIRQDSNGQSNSRNFSFLKPRMELRYDITGSDQLRLFAERTISQLNLNDFVASRNIDDDLINFGNPNLSPESTWRYSLGYERRFKNDGGSLNIEFFYENISDHIDKILIGVASSGTGNIGDARNFGLETEFNTRFGFIGMPNAVITLRYDYQNSRTTDPFTGELRLMRRHTPHFWNLDFRHDIEGTKFAYGFNGHRRSISKRQDISLRETVRFKRHVEAYAEYNLTTNMKLRFTAHRFLGDATTADKTFYIGNIADGIIDRIDFQSNSIKTEYRLRLQGTF